MEFEWDPGKSDATVTRRGFDFAFAVLIFMGRVLERVDTRRDYGERRVQAIGEANGRVMFVVYTDRASGRRIISARPANRKERLRWLNLSA